MDNTTFLIIALAALAAAGIAVAVLRRSWGGSLDQGRYPLSGAADAPAASLSDDALREAQALLARGNKIAAIKLVREQTGMSLKDAKDFVERLPASAPVASPPADVPQPLPDPNLAEVYALLARGNKIAAIKRYRELTGVGLKEAKDFVESL